MVAMINYAMVRAVLGDRLSLQTNSMRRVSGLVRDQALADKVSLDTTALKLAVDSRDCVGEAAHSFNELVGSSSSLPCSLWRSL